MSYHQFKTAVLGLCVILIACGGGGSAPPSSQPATCAPQSPTPVLALFGDSTMSSLGVARQTMQLAFDAELGAGRVVVQDRSDSGTSSGVLLRTWPNGTTPFDLAIDNHGINDCLTNVTIADFKANLRELVARGVDVLETPNPITAKACSAFAVGTREVATELAVRLVDTEAFVYSVNGWSAHMPDGIHPDAWLYGEIAKNRAAALMPKVRAAACR